MSKTILSEIVKRNAIMRKLKTICAYLIVLIKQLMPCHVRQTPTISSLIVGCMKNALELNLPRDFPLQRILMTQQVIQNIKIGAIA